MSEANAPEAPAENTGQCTPIVTRSAADRQAEQSFRTSFRHGAAPSVSSDTARAVAVTPSTLCGSVGKGRLPVSGHPSEPRAASAGCKLTCGVLKPVSVWTPIGRSPTGDRGTVPRTGEMFLNYGNSRFLRNLAARLLLRRPSSGCM